MKMIIRKIGKIILKIIGVILCLVVLMMIIGVILHNTYFKNQLEEIKPYGEMVEVAGKKMHVFSMGSGDETIVLLPGHGVPLPSADFAPLMRKLSEHYKVVTVEYFGVGFSDETDTPRTDENYMNEVREALNKVGVKPPYILMPHSISGIYSEYYATKHPEEVKGLILLDTTSTAYTMDLPNDILKQYKIAKFTQEIGLNQVMLSFISSKSLENMGFGLSIKNGYNQNEINDYIKYSCISVNDTIIEQMKCTMDCVKEVKDIPFPKDIPVLKIIAKSTVENENKIENIGSMEYQKAHINRLGDNASYVILDGTHFIYHDQLNEIFKLTDEFIDNLE